MGYAHGIQWSDELIKKKILEAKEALELDRMPSRAECEQFFHNTSLTNAVSRRVGWYALANELNLPIKSSETYFGKRYEAVAEEMLISKGFSVRRMSTIFPYDLLIDDCVKIDVKASHLYRGKNGNFYTFNLEKDYATCDMYILFAINDANDISETFVIPSKFVVSKSQISIGEHASKYHRFVDKWEYIDGLSKYWDGIV